jgi:arylsulfatase A-like enzyme
VEFVLLPVGPHGCRVLTGSEGDALVERDARGTISYTRIHGDPLALGGDCSGLSDTEAWELTADSEYPDALVQILAIAGAPRAGDIIVSAAPGWDLRTRWEPSLHVSGHGALRRAQMQVPLLMSRPAARSPRRTTDIFPSALAALGLPIPPGLDGESFR